MIKFLAEKEGRPMVGLGLSRGNCRKLLEGKPIFIDLKVLMMTCESVPDLNEATVLIFGGEDEYEMAAEIQRYIGPAPIVRTHDSEN